MVCRRWKDKRRLAQAETRDVQARCEEKIFTTRTVRQENRLPREVPRGPQAPSSEAFKDNIKP